EPTVYTCQVFTLKADADADIAIMAQTAQIHGTVSGDLDFFGQLLMIRRGAVIKGDLNVKGAQVIDLLGRVEGEITGSYQTIRDQSSESGPAPNGTPSERTDRPEAVETRDQESD
ncbi:MAG: bactofilin family protein, partial [Planctomycetota bacterium]